MMLLGHREEHILKDLSEVSENSLWTVGGATVERNFLRRSRKLYLVAKGRYPMYVGHANPYALALG